MSQPPPDNGNENKEIYLYKMPTKERENLCKLLDELNIWEELAINHMGYQQTDLIDIKKCMHHSQFSPTDKLLTIWGQQNHFVYELYIILYRMKQLRAMDEIKNLVDLKYHKLQLILEAQQKTMPSVSQAQNNRPEEKLLNLAPGNENQPVINSTSDNVNISAAKNPIKVHEHINNVARSIPEINYNELRLATNNWSEQNVLGRGGFGKVYRAEWKESTFAIKCLGSSNTTNQINNNVKIEFQQILNELKFLNSCRHYNILQLCGYSIDGGKPCLVYEFMEGGSVEQRLMAKNTFQPLNWLQRLKIAEGTARGLQYLHTFQSKPLIHGDIKSANILLDETCCKPKIGDFGLAREGRSALNESMEVSRVYGTKPYLPEEFLGSKSLSTKVDVYSFGIVLFELVTGLRAYDKNRKFKLLKEHILENCQRNIPIEQLMDSKLPISECGTNISKIIIDLGRKCVEREPTNRPEMLLVFQDLKNIKL